MQNAPDLELCNVSYCFNTITQPQLCSGRVSALEREVDGSILCRVIPKTLKMVVVAALLGAQGYMFSVTIGWFQDKWTSSTGN